MKKYGEGFAILSIQFSGFMHVEPLWIWYIVGFSTIVVITFLYIILVRIRKPPPFYIQCHYCTYRGLSTYRLKGSLFLELLLLILFFPGIFYGLWRCINRELVCPSCGSGNVIRIV